MNKIEIAVKDFAGWDSDGVIFIDGTVLSGGDTFAKQMQAEVGILNDAILCGLGEAVISSGNTDPCCYTIYARGPEWRDGNKGEASILALCCDAALNAAEKANLKTVDILSLPTGIYNSQLFQAASVVLQSAVAYLRKGSSLDRVRILCQDEPSAVVYKQAYNFWFADEKVSRIMDDGWD